MPVRETRQRDADRPAGRGSEYWRQMLADISGLQLDYRTGGDVGPPWVPRVWRKLR